MEWKIQKRKPKHHPWGVVGELKRPWSAYLTVDGLMFLGTGKDEDEAKRNALALREAVSNKVA